MADVAAYEPRLKTKYREEIRATLKEKFGYANEMMIPRLDKVVINMGVGEAAQDSKKIRGALADRGVQRHRRDCIVTLPGIHDFSERIRF